MIGPKKQEAILADGDGKPTRGLIVEYLRRSRYHLIDAF
jgi:hypothetical protein